MSASEQIKSIGLEFNALKSRVRNIIGNSHWGEDGRSKESVLQSILSNYVPESLALSSGFIVDKTTLSKQIDVMLSDKGMPTLFKGGMCGLSPLTVLRGYAK